jgi:alkanesulfonate monooxygenase SsuD/methylene tetrahydromethanopterin reductase-like flavin-dependent oxidoreductase (luciferase family)
MDIGVVLPQRELGTSVADLRRYATDVESLGMRHILVYDHVLGADAEVHQPWDWPYDARTEWHEAFVALGYLAALTSIELLTGVIVLPQRQTALVAKQCAELDLLTSGNFRLGVGVGWNHVEYASLGKDFDNRGARTYEQVVGAGIAPLPSQRPIPIWMGAQSTPAYRRVGRLADGWFPHLVPGRQLDTALAVIAEAAQGAGRDPAAIGLHARVNLTAGGASKLVDHLGRWREAGAEYVSINTMDGGLRNVDEHLGIIAAVADQVGANVTAVG